MSAKFFFRNHTISGPTLSNNRALSTQQGNAVVNSDSQPTANGPSSGIQILKDGSGVSWFTPPLKAGTISGTMTFNLWGYESNLLANVGFDVAVDLYHSNGSLSANIIRSEKGTELGLASAVQNWTDTPITPVTIEDNDQIRVKVFGNDAGGTMAASYLFLLRYGAAAGGDGDSWIQFAEDLPLIVYPTPLRDGPQYLKYLKQRKDYDEITVRQKFEDGGVDTLEHAANAPQRYALSYYGLDEQQAQVLDDFWDAHRLSGLFTFFEPRDAPWSEVYGTEGNEVIVQFESYKGDHSKVNIQSREVVLVDYPA